MAHGGKPGQCVCGYQMKRFMWAGLFRSDG